jgi:hypothetical protein
VFVFVRIRDYVEGAGAKSEDAENVDRFSASFLSPQPGSAREEPVGLV